MAAGEHEDPLGTRPPTLDDLLFICGQLNEHGARYIVVGGFALFEYGLARLTEDLDLLVDSDPHNVARIKDALKQLPDNAVAELEETDLIEHGVVRVNDEVTIDLLSLACGVNYSDAAALIEWREVGNIRIPFASPQLLWKTKQSPRQKDALDREFLRKWFSDRGLAPPN